MPPSPRRNRCDAPPLLLTLPIAVLTVERKNSVFFRVVAFTTLARLIALVLSGTSAPLHPFNSKVATRSTSDGTSSRPTSVGALDRAAVQVDLQLCQIARFVTVARSV